MMIPFLALLDTGALNRLKRFMRDVLSEIAEMMSERCFTGYGKTASEGKHFLIPCVS
jgi:hypothetical protein